MSDTGSSEDERPSFGGLGLGANRRKFVSGARDEGDESPAKKMRFSKQSKGKKDEAPGYSKAGSFASRMMAQMGYKEGEGLGKEGKGRLAPIETQLRPQGAGLGAVKEKTKQAKQEEKREAAFRGEKIEDSSEEEQERRKQRVKQPGAGPGRTYQKPKTKYRTVREIEEDSKGLEVPDVLKTLIDVSGNKTELLLADTSISNDAEEVKIAKRARRDLESYAENWRALQERKRYYDHEFRRHIREMDLIQERASALEKMIAEVEKLSRSKDDDIDSVSETIQLLETRLHLNGEGEFEETLKSASLNMQEVTVAALSPSFKRIMDSWDPLEEENPHKIVDSLAGVREYLGLQEDLAVVDATGVPLMRNRKHGSYYETLVKSYFLPTIRGAITNRWKVEDPEPVTKIVEVWNALLPNFQSSNIMNELIIPRLTDSIKRWRPGPKRTSETISIRTQPDVFLFPWLPLLPTEHLDPKASSSLLSDVRRKFAQESGKYDVSAGPPAWITPWSKVKAFRQTLSELYTNHLVPRLAQYLDRIDYEPTEDRRTVGDLSTEWPLRSLADWHKVLGDTTMSHLLSAHFFPRLMAATYKWLITEPPVPEVGNYMRFWQRRMDDSLQALPAVHAGWTTFFAMVKKAFELGECVAKELPMPENASAQRRASNREIEDLTDDEDLDNEPIEQTFKDVVEEWCEEYELILVPLHSAHTATGLPLYRITASASGRGGVQVYLKGDVVWAQSPKEKGKFVPMELGDQLAAWGGGSISTRE